MKTIFLLLFSILTIRTVAQPSKTAKVNNSIQPTLNQVMEAYFNHFQSSLGDKKSDSPGSAIYDSKVKLSGALSCTVVKYDIPGTYSWTAVMAEDEDFQVADKKYKQYFEEINKQNFTPLGYAKYMLTGKMDAPNESRNFASSLLQFNSEERQLRDFYVNLEIQYEFPSWVVKISIYNKIPDKEIRPGMKSITGED